MGTSRKTDDDVTTQEFSEILQNCKVPPSIAKNADPQSAIDVLQDCAPAADKKVKANEKLEQKNKTVAENVVKRENQAETEAKKPPQIPLASHQGYDGLTASDENDPSFWQHAHSGVMQTYQKGENPGTDPYTDEKYVPPVEGANQGWVQHWLVHVGNRTTTQGIVLNGASNAQIEGNPIALLGSVVSPCAKCGKYGVVVQGYGNYTIGGVPVALDGFIVHCGCPDGTNKLMANHEKSTAVWVPADYVFVGAELQTDLSGLPVAEGIIGIGSLFVPDVGASLLLTAASETGDAASKDGKAAAWDAAGAGIGRLAKLGGKASDLADKGIEKGLSAGGVGKSAKDSRDSDRKDKSGSFEDLTNSGVPSDYAQMEEELNESDSAHSSTSTSTTPKPKPKPSNTQKTAPLSKLPLLD